MPAETSEDVRRESLSMTNVVHVDDLLAVVMAIHV
jgi:hypothetical protein